MSTQEGERTELHERSEASSPPASRWRRTSLAAVSLAALLTGCAQPGGQASGGATVQPASFAPDPGAAKPALQGGDASSDDERQSDGGAGCLPGLSLFSDTADCLDGTMYEAKFGAQSGGEGQRVTDALPRVSDRAPSPSFFLAGERPASDDDVGAPELKVGRVIRNEAIDAYLQSTLADVLASAPAPNRPIAIHLFAEAKYTAEAAPTNDIFISLELLQSSQSHDELAFVIAHEASHILLGHHDRQELFEAQRGLAETALTAAVIASTISNTRASGSGGNLTLGMDTAGKARAQDQMVKAALIREAVDFAGSTVISSSWAREQEDEADLLGADLVQRAGMSAAKGSLSFDRLAETQNDRESRMERLDAHSLGFEQAIQSDPSLNGVVAGATIAAGNIAVAGLHDIRDFFKRKHLSAESRREHFGGYVTRHYEESELAALSALADGGNSVDPLKAAKEKAGFSKIYAGYKDVMRAQKAFDESRFNDALGLIEAAYREAPDIRNDPYPRSLEANIHLARSDRNSARRAYEAIDRSAVLTPAAFGAWMGIEIGEGRLGPARAVYDRAATSYPGATITNLQLQLELAEGQEAAAAATFERCQRIRDEGIVQSCRALWAQTHPGAAPVETGTLPSVLEESPLGDVGKTLDGLGVSLGKLF